MVTPIQRTILSALPLFNISDTHPALAYLLCVSCVLHVIVCDKIATILLRLLFFSRQKFLSKLIAKIANQHKFCISAQKRMDSMQSLGNGKHHNGHNHHGHRQKHRKLASSEHLHSGKRKRVDQTAANTSQPQQQLPEDVASLPVYAHKQEVLDALRTHSTLVVVGETGSGKSTQLPKIIFQAGLGNVVCTQVRLHCHLTMRIVCTCGWTIKRMLLCSHAELRQPPSLAGWRRRWAAKLAGSWATASDLTTAPTQTLGSNT